MTSSSRPDLRLVYPDDSPRRSSLWTGTWLALGAVVGAVIVIALIRWVLL